jgi:prophage tail gpP-like protein
MALINPFYLDIDGRTFSGWLRVRLERSIDNATIQWGVNATRTWPGMQGSWWIEPGDRVNVRIYDHRICSGWIDNVQPNYDGGQHVIEISGRGLVGDLCDCSYIGPPWQWKSVDPAEVIRTIAAQHQIKVNIAADLGEPLKFQVQQGEACWDAIERIARLRQCLAYEEPDGSLLITRGSEEFVETELVQGELILAANATLDDKDRYSHYIVKGQQKAKKKAAKKAGGAGGGGDDYYGPPAGRSIGEPAPYATLGEEEDEIPPEQASFSMGEVRDPSMRRYRPKLLTQSANTDNGNALDRAKWEMQNRWGKSRKCEITLGGWLQPNGELWPINRRCAVIDDWLGLDRDLAIVAVTHDVSNSGLRTVLTLQPPEALIPEPAKPEKGKGGKKGGKGKGKGKGGGGAGGSAPDFWNQVAGDKVISDARRKESRQ